MNPEYQAFLAAKAPRAQVAQLFSMFDAHPLGIPCGA